MAHLVLYDGVCGLCEHFVQFLLRIDRGDHLRFAALQGPLGTEILRQRGREAHGLSSVLAIPDYGESDSRLLERSDAAIFVVAAAGGGYRAARAFRVIPRFLRDAIYHLIARWRYRIFGRFDACPLPSAETRAKFLDVTSKTLKS